ncbi:MAG: glycosyltransferase [Candidatus Sericytochromatia bacterium]|nr:glycosyltransferase [Candidatus Sericytochromatia bacterium]
MKILMLADPGSSHTLKWVRGLSERGISIYLFGLSKFDKNDYLGLDNVIIDSIYLNEKIFASDNIFSKLKYFSSLKKVKKIVLDYNPDIVHAHYATSYGLLGALLNFHPYIISVWGSDVYDFPEKSFFNKLILKYNLKKSDKICSTSNAMVNQTKKYTNKDISVVPFGIDLKKFKPSKKVKKIFSENSLVIGTIKTLEEKYGVEYLIKAFKFLADKYPEQDLKLLIVGGGSQEKFLKNMVKEFNLTDKTVFTGKIKYDDIVEYYNELDIYLALSIYDSESFGVAVVEAGACEKPVIVSNMGGLPEVVEDQKTGFIINSKDYIQAAYYLEILMLNLEQRVLLGKNARERVNNLFNFEDNLKLMIEVYKKVSKI